MHPVVLGRLHLSPLETVVQPLFSVPSSLQHQHSFSDQHAGPAHIVASLFASILDVETSLIFLFTMPGAGSVQTPHTNTVSCFAANLCQNIFSECKCAVFCASSMNRSHMFSRFPSTVLQGYQLDNKMPRPSMSGPLISFQEVPFYTRFSRAAFVPSLHFTSPACCQQHSPTASSRPAPATVADPRHCHSKHVQGPLPSPNRLSYLR